MAALGCGEIRDADLGRFVQEQVETPERVLQPIALNYIDEFVELSDDLGHMLSIARSLYAKR